MFDLAVIVARNAAQQDRWDRTQATSASVTSAKTNLQHARQHVARQDTPATLAGCEAEAILFDAAQAVRRELL